MGNARRRGNPASQTFPLLLLIITAVFVPPDGVHLPGLRRLQWKCLERIYL